MWSFVTAAAGNRSRQLVLLCREEVKEALGGSRKTGQEAFSILSQKDSGGLGQGGGCEEEVKMAGFWIHFEGSVEVN